MRIVTQLAVALGTTASELTGETSMVMIPSSLREFAVKNELPYEIVDKLARIPRRGKEPATPEEWEKLFQSIKRYLDLDVEV
jgi:hypothetical protein